MSIPFIGHIERGTRAPSLESLLTLCNVLRVTPNYLLQDYLKIPNVDLSSEVISTADLYSLDKILAHPARGRRNAALGGMEQTEKGSGRKTFRSLFSAVCRDYMALSSMAA